MNDLSTTCATGVAEAHAERMAGVVDNGALAVMVSIGHGPGLFEMFSGPPAVTSAEPGAEAGFPGRNVRDWLAVMAPGRIVTYVPAPGRYGLPCEHAAFLVKGTPPGNLAVFAHIWRSSVKCCMRRSTSSRRPRRWCSPKASGPWNVTSRRTIP